MALIPAPTPFQPTEDQSGTYQQWISWRDNLAMYFAALRMTDDGQKYATLLYCGGKELTRIHKTLEGSRVLTVVDNSTNPATTTHFTEYDASINVLNNYFAPKRNDTFERHKFRSTNQMDDESTLAYITRLRELASTCSFDTYSTEAAIVDQVVEKCKSKEIRKRFLTTTDLTLEKVTVIAQTEEIAQAQATALEANNGNQTENHKSTEDSTWFTTDRKPKTVMSKRRQTCYGCGSNNHIHNSNNCPAKGKRCNFCGFTGHFEKVCRKKQAGTSTNNTQNTQQTTRSPATSQAAFMNTTESRTKGEDDDSTESYLFYLYTTNSHNSKHKITTVHVDEKPIDFVIDSGATCDIIDYQTFQQNFKDSVTVYPTYTKIYTYGRQEPLPLAGMFYPCLSIDNRRIIGPVMIAKAATAGCILSEKSSSSLGLLKITESVNLIDHEKTTIPNCLSQFEHTFTGIGKLKDYQLHLDIDQSITPTVQPIRRVPYHKRQIINDEIDKMLDLDIIEPSPGPTTWCSPLHVVTNKDGNSRICIDLRKANTAVKRTRFPIPTLDDVLDKVAGSKIFSKIDLRKAYHQIELDEKSRDITTFVCSKGLFRYKRLVFGISSAFEQFQRIIGGLFNRESGITNIADDILIYSMTEEEHEKALKRCFQILSDHGLTVNKQKCKFYRSEIEFYGFIISSEGIKPVESKVEAINKFPRPQNPKEIRSFLGLVNYLGRFIPNLSTLSEPLRSLTRGGTDWKWTQIEEQCFQALKQAVMSASMVVHFDTKKETKVVADASPIGLGAILLQLQEDDVYKPVAFASRALTPVESRYSQTEREALSIVWACEKFHIYVVGKPFVIDTDHKPLLGIYNTNGKPSTRITRWSLRLQPYTFTLNYIPGGSNPADILSRHPINNQLKFKSVYAEEAEQHINYHIAHAIPKSVSLSTIVTASENDKETKEVRNALATGKWHSDKCLKPYIAVKQELAEKSGILLRSERIIIPKALRKNVLEIAHETHQGITKTKALLREKVWWPGINEDIQNMIKSCTYCLCTQPADKGEPLKMTKMPELWDTVHADICGPFPDGWSILGIVDECSRWPSIFLVGRY